eukprot:scaffold28493_cov66-Phaeocystis_antarctica.AAC.3
MSFELLPGWHRNLANLITGRFPRAGELTCQRRNSGEVPLRVDIPSNSSRFRASTTPHAQTCQVSDSRPFRAHPGCLAARADIRRAPTTTLDGNQLHGTRCLGRGRTRQGRAGRQRRVLDARDCTHRR